MDDWAYVGRIEPSSRTSQSIDCQECEATIPDHEPAYLYLDGDTLNLLCRECHTIAK